MTRAEQLQAFVMAVEGKPVEWGRDDCTTWAAAWVKEVTGRAVPQLGSYATLEEAHTLIDEAGGLDVLWSMALAPLSIYETPDQPQLGDVGIVNTARLGHVGVIFAQDGIALWRAIEGTALLRPRSRDIVKVWHI
ncbi:hypothetical protein [Mesorhizobium sp. WSM2239]|uniref:DUF6950 domain-containing protein n=2 Tax=unclassified Mesorhizobium TaxID=325217 RepID=A0AAU8D1Y5_9HYPH